MPVHIHAVRNWCANGFLLVPALVLLGWALAPGSKDSGPAQVSGRVTYAGQPVSGSIYFLPEDEGGSSAIGPVNPDGSFQLYVNGDWDRRGAVPGTYRVVLRPRVPNQTASHVDSKYQDAHTSDLLVHVWPDWNELRLNLR
jgi:hypothetical protein